jgi:DNA ligase (NAD+)
MVNDQLFCRNTACPAQLNKKIEHFAKTLVIKGLGPKAIEKLNLSDITELYYLEQEETAKLLGSEKVAEKLLQEIEKSKQSGLGTVLASFSIPLIGSTAGAKLASVVRSIEEINPQTCKDAGLGEKATSNLMHWLGTEFLELKDFLPFDFKSKPVAESSSDSKTICITGKLKSFKTKSEATTILIKLGFKVVESITKTTDYLVDEEDKQSSKRQKADQYGITIINNLMEFIKQNDRQDCI